MCRSRNPSSKASQAGHAPTESLRPLAAEEIQLGDFVVVLREVTEFPAVLWFCDTPASGAETVIRVPLLAEESGVPRRVDAVYLPFVMVKPPRGTPQMLDVRRHKIARVQRQSTRTVWRAVRRAHKKAKPRLHQQTRIRSRSNSFPPSSPPRGRGD